MTKTLGLAALAAAAVAAGAFWTLAPTAPVGTTTFSTAAFAQGATASSEAMAVPDMVLGQETAPVTVIEYASFTCPHCANFHDTVYDQLKANYIDTGKVKFVYREVYFDRFGLWAAMVARCAGPEKYFGISDILYDKQKDWLAPQDPAAIADNLRKIGLQAGMNAEQVDACLKDNDMAKAMVAAYQTNATADGIDSTPSFIVDGQKYSNMSYEDFAKILDEKLAN